MFVSILSTKSKTLQMLLLLDKLSNENKDIMIKGDFNVNLINLNDSKTPSSFLDAIFSCSFLPLLPPQLKSLEILKH